MNKLLAPGPMSILVLLCMAPVGVGMKAYALDDVPTKKITIYNHSKKDTIYPVLTGYVGDVDLWLQAQFGISSGDAGIRTFCNSFPNPTENNDCIAPSGHPPTLFRAYINFEKGVLPGEFVTVDVPFYTQLKETTEDNLGRISGQFIDWWNASRVFLYNGKTAQTGAYYYNVDENGVVVSPPPVVTPFSGAAAPSCAPDNENNCEDPILVRYVGGFPTGSIPFQLGEYTFASAEGPPPGGLLSPGSDFQIDIRKTNFNVSAVDGVYLPVAMAAMLEDDPVKEDQQYLGTTEQYSAFRQRLENFSKLDKSSVEGDRWPFYWPSYFDPDNPTVALPRPPEGFDPYVLPSIPSAFVMITESYKVPTPAPPVISSNSTANEGLDPMIGKEGKELVQLWDRCTISSDNGSDTCGQIRLVRDFFLLAYSDCGNSGTPEKIEMLEQVYGWAQWPGCSRALADTDGFDEAIKTYCELQYNYLFATPQSGNDDTFNAYNRLIHKGLQSNAYGFSIDDKAAFKSVPSTDQGTSPGLIITIGGPKGLPDPNNQVPLPNAKNFTEYCN